MNSSSIKIEEIRNNQSIIKPNFHLNTGKLRINTAIQNGCPFSTLKEVTEDIYTGGIFKRLFVSKKDFGYPYISAQIMQNSTPLDVAKYISKKYTPRQEDMSLEETQILVSCAGTVGNTRLVSKDLNGYIGSQDIIRVISNNSKIHYGFIYAYLSTPTIYNFIQSYIYGSVVPRIEPKTLSTLPVLSFSMETRDKVSLLISESYSNRNKALVALNKAISIFSSYLPDLEVPSASIIKLSDITKGRKRFDATYNRRILDEFYSKLKLDGYCISKLDDISKKIFTPNIFKRIRTKSDKSGIPYLGGAELLQLQPKLTDYLSRKTKNIDNYKLSHGWITVQDSGSIQTMGYVTLIPSYLDNVTATNNLVRVIPSEEQNYNNYIFTFLRTKQGQQILKMNSYGTGQLHIDNTTIEKLEIPVIPEIQEKVNTLIDEYLSNIDSGFEKESQAIKIIENEISSWQ